MQQIRETGTPIHVSRGMDEGMMVFFKNIWKMGSVLNV